MRLGVVEELGVETRMVQHRNETCLGIYCAECAAGIVMVALRAEDRHPAPECDWQSDHDVQRAIENHHRKHHARPR